jgi:SAM-dependent methyltransferase
MASHVVEHIPPANLGFIKFMNEVWRILKPGCEFAIVTPHGWSAGYLQDPSHVAPFNENTFLYFVQDHPLWNFYRPSPWTIKYLSWSYTANIEVVMVKAALHD